MQKNRKSRQPTTGDEAQQIREWLDQHPEVVAQIKIAIEAGERGEGVPFGIVEEEARRRRTKRSS